MSGKPTGLAAFARNKAAGQAAATNQPVTAAETPAAGKRSRGQGETVALTVRVTRSDWERLHQLAIHEGVSLQSLAMLGLSRVFTDKGLPPLNS
jgi:hypothetical protein